MSGVLANAEGFVDRWFRPDVRSKLNPKKSVAEIAAILETGTKDGRIPPRPLFGPLGDRVAKSVGRYFLAFLRRHYPDYAKLVSGVTSSEKKG